MKAYYTNQPSQIEPIGHGKYYVNMDIVETEDGYGCEQVKINGNPTYSVVVEALIRERYSVSDEIALLRQKETKPTEYAEYDAFCEACKAKAQQVFPGAGKGGE